MKTRPITALLLGLLAGLLLCALSGCSLLPPLSPSRAKESIHTALEVHLGSALPEDVALSWDPDVVTLDSAEVSVTENGPSRVMTVTIQLRQP